MIDENDGRLLASVRPPDYRNPSPAPMYDLVVIGGGTAGLVSAAGAAGLGARVALVEKNRLGGDCLNTGCVPSKALLRSARAVAEARFAAALGVRSSAHADFAAVMTRMRARRADLAPHDSVERFTGLGVHVFFGTASFLDGRAIRVTPSESIDPGDRVLRFRKAVIATGSRPAVPAIPGLSEIAYLTTDTLFDLDAQPRSLAIIGGGPVGCEIAQAFALLGTTVTLLESGPQLLGQEDPDAAAVVLARLRDDGVRVWLGSHVKSVRREAGCTSVVHDAEISSVDAVLVAAGRSRAIEGLNLEAAGVEHGPRGIAVDDYLRTRNRRIYAAGDVCSPVMFTHVADETARVVVQNALFFGRRRLSRLIVPWCTFTSPEVARVGITGAEASARGAATITVQLSEVDRAVVDEAGSGFVRVHHDKGRIVGATIVAAGAGELIGTIALAMQHGHTLDDLASSIFPYPTLSLALRRAADQYRRGRLTPAVRRLLRYYFRASR